jgi:hypothetical protein
MQELETQLPLWKLATARPYSTDRFSVDPHSTARLNGPLTNETIMGIQLQRGAHVLDILTGQEGIVLSGTINYQAIPVSENETLPGVDRSPGGRIDSPAIR